MAEKPYTEMTVDELDAETVATIADQRRRGLSPVLVRDLGRTLASRTRPISLRMPSHLLEELRAEALRVGVGYQTLLIRLVEAGLAGSAAAAPARVRVPAEAVRAGHLVIDVELVEPPPAVDVTPRR